MCACAVGDRCLRHCAVSSRAGVAIHVWLSVFPFVVRGFTAVLCGAEHMWKPKPPDMSAVEPGVSVGSEWLLAVAMGILRTNHDLVSFLVGRTL